MTLAISTAYSSLKKFFSKGGEILFKKSEGKAQVKSLTKQTFSVLKL